MRTYRINEIFYSLQGEGIRAGTANVFVRFTGCNLRCAVTPGPKSPGGFNCDTEFTGGVDMTHSTLADNMASAGPVGWAVLTGGEPGLQTDTALVEHLHERGWRLAIETNGSVELPDGLDWITVSPKVAEHAIRQRTAHEVKYVRAYGQALPKTVVEAEHYLISPAFNGLELDPTDLDWCIRLVKENPKWRLSLQQHKLWKVR